jgi:hypothetical protein
VVVVLLGTDILHLVDAAALGAPLDRALAGHLGGCAVLANLSPTSL